MASGEEVESSGPWPGERKRRYNWGSIGHRRARPNDSIESTEMRSRARHRERRGLPQEDEASAIGWDSRISNCDAVRRSRRGGRQLDGRDQEGAAAVVSITRIRSRPRKRRRDDQDGEAAIRSWVRDESRIRNYDDQEEEAADRHLSTLRINKSDGQIKILTLDKSIPSSCLNDDEFHFVRAYATKMILKASKFVVCLSSYIDNKLLRQCSGILIEWDANSNDAVVLTSAHIICCKSSLNEWLGEQKYDPYAKIIVQLATATTKGQLLYYHKHYGFALIRVTVDQPAEVASFENEVNFMQSVYLLGRDDELNLRVSSGKVQHEGPTVYERHHYMYMHAVVPEFAIGGPIVDINGYVVGMASLSAHMGFIPSIILQKCLHIMCELRCIPRLQLGLKLSPIMFLDINHIEKLSRECGFDTGLIVKEVAGGSQAEKLGIRTGDIILSVNEERIATTVELELMLLRICENNLGRGNGPECVDIPLDIFYMSRGKGDPVRINLTANVSEDVEVVQGGTYSDDEADSDDEALWQVHLR